MSEKGGRMFSLPTKTTPKSSLKSTAGKDDNSAKSKRGRKVQFGTEGSPDVNFSSPKSDGKFATPFGKGGKGEKIANGGKTHVAKESQSLELRVEQELPENIKCLMDCEAATILEGIQDQMVILSSDPTIKLPESFGSGLQYAKTGSYYTNPQSVRKVLQSLTKYGVSNSEICVIANTCPETVDEVFALVRSLEAKRSKITGPLKDVLDELAKLKTST
ncbi:DNA-directed RNA polymerases IV and V subunit 4 [Gossypium arboreum]|uniref:DNA-directed RNA polymerases IV and V subunit 4 n=1 Tax=Gossypium arboreum TaxID=29729 RepID=UPI000819692E|nr:DNA-directed RNA polymerases IV and V subunit 4 [Gossypium arboreum]XP_017612787.1 DNA-directed RNA polymerases IV and V subunit 4 [Gossypium arboreum]XP_017612788.1 DNA-directed RNA polymerases IV and V subunit 4 [Gossypium arboreum]XP_052886154.1 DNA-directed RNA polymerases IV and V subunit 4 [Gossypium arboreum]